MKAAEHIKSHVSIVQGLEHYIPLIKKGGAMMASCPLHSDRTPSLSIQPDKGLWHCFSCNKGGDLIRFVQLVEGCGFIEACRKLVEAHNIPPPIRVYKKAIRSQIRDLEAAGSRPGAVALIDKLKIS